MISIEELQLAAAELRGRAQRDAGNAVDNLVASIRETLREEPDWSWARFLREEAERCAAKADGAAVRAAALAFQAAAKLPDDDAPDTERTGGQQ